MIDRIAAMMVSFALLPVIADAREARLYIEGEPPTANAEFDGFSSDQRIRFRVAGETRDIRAKQVVAWGAPAQELRGSCVVLTDGSILVADLVAWNSKTMQIESDVWPPTEIPENAICGILFKPPTQPLAQARMIDRLRTYQGKTDQLMLANGDVLNGHLVDSAEIGEPKQEESILGLEHVYIRPTAGQSPIEIPIENITALSLARSRSAASPKPPHLLVGLRDGSLLRAARWASNNAELTIVLSCGVRLAAARRDTKGNIVFLQPVGIGARYVSDLPPLAYRHVPFLQIDQPLGRDRNALGGWLNNAGRRFPKGIGMQGTSRVVYDLLPDDRTFAAELAIDSASKGQGSVVFRVFLERGDESGGSRWELAFQSDIVRGADKPESIRVDLANARRIALVTDFAEWADVGDFADWLNARLIASES